MGAFTRIPADTFEQIQTDAGILLYKFDPEHPDDVKDEDIICPTTGGITAAAEPTYSDMGEDVDNCPSNLLELKHLDGWNCHLDFTSLGTSPKSIRLALGAADVDSDNKTHIVPRVSLKTTDAGNVWWVGDRADGGMVAVCLKRALSTSGFSLQTSKNGKGQTSVTLTGHVSVATQSEVPMEFYSVGPTSGKVMEQDYDFGGELGDEKTVADLITPETYVQWRGVNGHVQGTLKKVESWEGFSSSTAEQSGFYFPFKFSDEYEGKTIKVQGGAKPKEAVDLEWVLRVAGKDGAGRKTFTFSVDDEVIAVLDFDDAKLEGAGT